MTDDYPSESSRAPLISIGAAMVVVLLVPVVLYSVGPEGPLKVGDVVFATNRYRVKFADPTIPRTQGYQDFCILELRVQLVVEKIQTMPDSFIIAKLIGVEEIDVPYCPPRTPVFLHPYQVTLKADLWGGFRDTLSSLVSGR